MPILDEHTLDFISHSPAQTRRVGIRLGVLLQAGDLICLEGELGTGKTCLIQGIGQGMGVARPITSPTFTLVAEYRLPPPAPTLYHIDLYRLESEDEVLDIGIEDYIFGGGITIVEWADRMINLLPEKRIDIELSFAGDMERVIIINTYSDFLDAVIKEVLSFVDFGD